MATVVLTRARVAGTAAKTVVLTKVTVQPPAVATSAKVILTQAGLWGNLLPVISRGVNDGWDQSDLNQLQTDTWEYTQGDVSNSVDAVTYSRVVGTVAAAADGAVLWGPGRTSGVGHTGASAYAFVTFAGAAVGLKP